jgi:anti-sigma regulatory factor (Ser/Thr protein kinase)
MDRLGFTLKSAADVEEIVRAVLADLVRLPDVLRAGFALTEGGGRRLRFVAVTGPAQPRAPLPWCHIDAYDNVPLTEVVRTSESIVAPLADLEGRFPALVEHQRSVGTAALAAVPLLTSGSPIGGLLLYYGAPQAFDTAQRRELDAAARRTSEAVRRVRAVTGEGRDGAGADARGDTAGLVLPDDPQAPGVARHFLRDLLAQWSLAGDLADTAQLCLSELVTNAVIHARTDCELTVRLEAGVLTVTVHDRGLDAEPVVPSEDEDPLKVFGRGLMLVDALADRWGSQRGSGGTTAWFALEVHGQRAETQSVG